MANTLLKSNEVTVFPSTKTQSVNKLITENSLTRLINRLLNSESYVITYGDSWSDIDVSTDVVVGANVGQFSKENPFEVCLGGYYIGVNTLNTLMNIVGWSEDTLNEGDTLTVGIYIDESVHNYPELQGQYTIKAMPNVSFNFKTGEKFISGVTDLPKGGEEFDYNQVQDLVLMGVDASTSKPIIISDIGAVSLTDDGKIICEKFIDGWTSANVKSCRYSILTDFTGLFVQITNNSLDDTYKKEWVTPTGIEGITEETKLIKLGVVKYFTPTNRNKASYIPIDSIHRFNTGSISTIDGGEIPVYK